METKMSEQQSLPPEKTETFAPVKDENLSGSPKTPPPSMPSDDGGGGVGSVLAIGLSIIALGLSVYLWYFQPNQPSNNIAVVDTQILVSAMVSREMANGVSPDELSNKLGALNTHLDGIAANGTVLLQKSAVVSPQGLPDLTEQIAQEMNIDIHNIQIPSLPQPQARQPESPVKAPDSDTAVMNNNGLDASLD